MRAVFLLLQLLSNAASKLIFIVVSFKIIDSLIPFTS